MLQRASQHFTKQKWESMALLQQASEVKGQGEVRGLRQRSNSTKLDVIKLTQCTLLIMHLLTLLTASTTIVSRHLLNPNSHTHTHTLLSHNLPTISVWLLSEGSASHLRSNSFMSELVFFISGSPADTSGIISFSQVEIFCL